MARPSDSSVEQFADDADILNYNWHMCRCGMAWPSKEEAIADGLQGHDQLCSCPRSDDLVHDQESRTSCGYCLQEKFTDTIVLSAVLTHLNVTRDKMILRLRDAGFLPRPKHLEEILEQ